MLIQYNYTYLTFSEDFLTIFEGHNMVVAGEIRHLSGNSRSIVVSTMLSTGTDMFINFLSDNGGSGIGFHIHYHSYGKRVAHVLKGYC